jgi:hypothetical protein
MGNNVCVVGALVSLLSNVDFVDGTMTMILRYNIAKQSSGNLPRRIDPLTARTDL